MRGSDYVELRAFAAVADRLSFSKGAADLGVSPSAITQTVKALEGRLGLRLFNRTTRSVSLTDAGVRLLARAGPAMAELESALSDVLDLRAAPSGLLRVVSPSTVADLYIRPRLAVFTQAYPDVVLDLTIDDEPVDVVRHGFDLGIRLGEFVEPGMVGVPLGGDQRQTAAASPDYLRRFKAPQTPDELVGHLCINWRRPGSAGLYPWEFQSNGAWFSMAVRGPLVVSDRRLAVAAALDGARIVLWAEEILSPHFKSGALVPLLQDWCASFPGWRLFYPSRSHLPKSVRAFIDFMAARGAQAGLSADRPACNP